MRGPKLRITCDKLVGRQMRVWLDDYEVTYLRSLELTMGHDQLSEVTLTLLPGTVEIDAEALVALQAYLKDPPGAVQ